MLFSVASTARRYGRNKRRYDALFGKQATAVIGIPVLSDVRNSGTTAVNVYVIVTCEKPLTPAQVVLLLTATLADDNVIDCAAAAFSM